MNKQNSILVSALLVAVGIALLGLFIKNGIDNLAFRDRQVTVKGLAEQTVTANQVTWPIDYNLAGDDLQNLYDRMTSYNNIIVNFLTSNGIDQSEINVQPPSTYNATANQWGSSNFNYKYSLSCTVTVQTSKVELVNQLLSRQSELLKSGVPYSNSFIDYQYTALNDIKPGMIADATKNARDAADKFAEDSGSRLGKIKTASQGSFSIEDTASPWIKKVRVVTTIVYYIED